MNIKIQRTQNIAVYLSYMNQQELIWVQHDSTWQDYIHASVPVSPASYIYLTYFIELLIKGKL